MLRQYEIFTATYDSSTFLGASKKLLDTGADIDFYAPSGTEKMSRKVFDGFITFVAKINGQEVGVCFNDFRSFGSSAGADNSHRVCAFIDFLDDKKIPLVYLCNSIGARVQDGRKVFKNSFSIIPKIKKFSESNLYIAASLGHTLGLAAVLYSLAHYRLAIKDKCQFNLTGPEVFKMFFGNNIKFEEVCNERVLFEENLLVQHISDSQDKIYEDIRSLLNNSQENIETTKSDAVLDQVNHIRENSIEVFSQFGKSVEIRIINTPSGRKGLIINPPGKPNMMTVKDIDKFIFALQLFKRMKLPVYSLIDTAGGDPRIEENNKNIGRKLYDLSAEIIDYPYRKQGIIMNRCYGGSSILSIPPFFGGEKSILLKGAHIGIMGDKIVRHLLQNTPALLDIWESNKVNEKEDYSDLIEEGIIDRIEAVENLTEILINS